MSLVYITHHNENIFDVDKQKEDFTTREKLKYTSKFRKMIKDEKQARHIIERPDNKMIVTSAVKYCHHTMGYAQTPLQLPCNYLRKNHGIKWQRLNEHVCPPKKEIPPVPHFPRPVTKTVLKAVGKEVATKKEKEDLSCPHTKYFRDHKHRANFVALNVTLIKNLKTKKPLPHYVDTPKGDRHNLVESGLMPQYVSSKKFAKVPGYLKARKEFLQQIRTQCEQVLLEDEPDECKRHDRYAGVKKLSTEERQNILQVNLQQPQKPTEQHLITLFFVHFFKGLKTNFTELFRIYQGLSLHTDTVAKKHHKSKLENDLRQLEQDIYLIEQNPEIFVSEY